MLNERKTPPATVGSTVTKGKNGTTSVDNNNPRLVTPDGKRRRSAKEILPNHTAGPVGKLPDHTVYHDMGMLMAESLGLVSETRGRHRSNFIAARDTSTIQDTAKKTGESPADLRKAGGSSTLASIAREGRERRERLAKAAAEKAAAEKPTKDK